jgi:predicted nuclease of predicted toxin-antitoxin system
VRFYLDENLSPEIGQALRRLGLDAISAHDVGMVGAPDPVQLAFAAGERRGLVTCDVLDFTEGGREAVRAHRPHAGIILCPASFRGDVGAVTRALARVAAHYPEGLGEYDVIFLTREA